MPKIHIEESILINQKAEKIYKFLSDYHNWQQWSPWLLAEPDCHVKVSEKGDFYSWDGSIVGSGEITITETSKHFDFLTMDLQFLKPWKSFAKVAFYLEKKDDKTLLKWTMESSLPIFLFWMKKSMMAFISEDYRRGLRMLKDLIETGKTNSEITFQGLKKQKAKHYVGVKREVATQEIDTYMSKDFEKLMTLYHNQWKSYQAGPAFTLYHKWDMVGKKVKYTSAVPLTAIPGDLPADFIQGKLPEMAVYSVLHQGPYRHVGNAWSAGMMHMRNKKFKPIKKQAPFEVYWNSPKDTPELELKSEILFPAKD